LRGYRLPKSSRKLDVVLVAARYTQRSQQLKIGQAYVRRGPIWSDLTLLSRDDLIQRLEDKQRIVTGMPAEIPGEFVVFSQVQLDQVNGAKGIYTGQLPAKGDDLGIPLF
jgi:hypothetical protein